MLRGELLGSTPLNGEIQREVIYGGSGGGIVQETDPTVPEHVKKITEEDIENWNNKPDNAGKTEVYVGDEEPTGDEVIWIDTSEESPKTPTKTSELENDSAFITKNVDDLANYYDKDYIDGALGDIETLLGGI